MVGFGPDMVTIVGWTHRLHGYVLVPPLQKTQHYSFSSHRYNLHLYEARCLRRRRFLGYIAALALQIHRQSTIVQWLYSTRFSVLTPPLSLQGTPKGLASIICTISTLRRSGSRTRVEILTAGATSPLTPGDQASLPKPCGHRYLKTKPANHVEMEITGVMDDC
jgi:hypothetical protein